MPIYHFNVRDGVSVPDLDGTDLPDIYTAQAEAIRLSGEILRDLGAAFWNGIEWSLEVTNSEGRILFILRFSAEEIEAGQPEVGSSAPLL